MQTRYRYKLLPNATQSKLGDEWLITLRLHRNYSLRERQNGWDNNNRDADQPVTYAYGAFCDVETRVEYGAACPLTCPVIKHGVIPHQLNDAQLVKISKEKWDKETGELIKPATVQWDSASGIQSKRTTQLRTENQYFSRIDSDVLQRNLAKLDAAYSGFWQHKRGFPAIRTTANFNSFEYKPGRAQFTVMNLKQGKHRYSRVYLPGLGSMRYFDSRPIPPDADIRTVTVIREADGWYISVLLNIPVKLPEEKPLEEVTGINTIDVGINKLIASSDGSFVENPRFATNPTTKRRLRIRQCRVSRKKKGSKNRSKAGKQVAKLHKKIRDKRESYQWQAAHKEVDKADAIGHEDLNIQGMKKRCKPVKGKNGRFLPNGQSAKRGLNRSISDAAWGGLFAKIAWLALKEGKPVLKYAPQHTSQECSKCGHVSPDNRDGEKFVCENCGHIDHADTQASRNGQKKIGLKFVSKRRKKPTHQNRKCLPQDVGESNALCSDAAPRSKRHQAGNPISKQLSLFDVAESGILAG